MSLSQLLILNLLLENKNITKYPNTKKNDVKCIRMG